MEDIINLNSRDGTINTLELLKRSGSNPKTYTIKTSAEAVRIGEKDGAINFIDLSGGPLISVGKPIAEADNAIVESIAFIDGYGYTVTFE